MAEGTRSRRLDICGLVGLLGVSCAVVACMLQFMLRNEDTCQSRSEGVSQRRNRAAFLALVAVAPVLARVSIAAAISCRACPGSRRTVDRQAGLAKTLLGNFAEGEGALSVDSKWTDGRDALALTQHQAVTSAVAKLVLWHWLQPLAYLIVLCSNVCYTGFSSHAKLGYLAVLAVLIAAREVLYLLSTVAAVVSCPVFLLIDPVTILRSDESAPNKTIRLASYVLAPHNFVAHCLMRRMRSGRVTVLSLASAFVVADCLRLPLSVACMYAAYVLLAACVWHAACCK